MGDEVDTDDPYEFRYEKLFGYNSTSCFVINIQFSLEVKLRVNWILTAGDHPAVGRLGMLSVKGSSFLTG